MITETKAIDTIFMKLAKAVKGKEEIAIFCVMFSCPWAVPQVYSEMQPLF